VMKGAILYSGLSYVWVYVVVISRFVNISHSCKKLKKESEHTVKIKVVGSSKTVVNLYHYTASHLGKCFFLRTHA